MDHFEACNGKAQELRRKSGTMYEVKGRCKFPFIVRSDRNDEQSCSCCGRLACNRQPRRTHSAKKIETELDPTCIRPSLINDEFEVCKRLHRDDLRLWTGEDATKYETLQTIDLKCCISDQEQSTENGVCKKFCENEINEFVKIIEQKFKEEQMGKIKPKFCEDESVDTTNSYYCVANLQCNDAQIGPLIFGPFFMSNDVTDCGKSAANEIHRVAYSKKSSTKSNLSSIICTNSQPSADKSRGQKEFIIRNSVCSEISSEGQCPTVTFYKKDNLAKNKQNAKLTKKDRKSIRPRKSAKCICDSTVLVCKTNKTTNVLKHKTEFWMKTNFFNDLEIYSNDKCNISTKKNDKLESGTCTNDDFDLSKKKSSIERNQQNMVKSEENVEICEKTFNVCKPLTLSRCGDYFNYSRKLKDIKDRLCENCLGKIDEIAKWEQSLEIVDSYRKCPIAEFESC